jgi:hypothetical protein
MEKQFNKDDILISALLRYADKNNLPSAAINPLLQQTQAVKDKILSLSDEEKSILLNAVSKEELDSLKSILRGDRP